MPWTAQSIKEAFRLTATDAMVGAALRDADFRARRYLGEPARSIRCEWRFPYTYRSTHWFSRGEIGLALPRPAESLTSIVSSGGEDIGNSYLSDQGWTIRRDNWVGFRLNRTITATVRLIDDEGARDGIIASMVHEFLGIPYMSAGWNWRRLLNDWKNPPTAFPLPDVVLTVDSGGAVEQPGADDIYIGLLAAAGDPIDFTGLTGTEYESPRISLAIPAFTGERYLFIASRSDRPIFSLFIGAVGGIDLIGTYTRRRAVLTHQGQRYDAWVSGSTLLGSVASGLPVTVGR